MATHTERQVAVEGKSSGLRQEIRIGSFELVSDEPVSLGGENLGPTPYELLLAALGSCTSMTIAMVARRRGWPLGGVRVTLQHDRVHADDCADCETRSGMVDRIEREVELLGPLSEEQRLSLLEIANKCPVARTLRSEIWIESRLKPAEASAAAT